MKLGITKFALVALCLSATPALAQTSAVQRANDKDKSSAEYRQTHCASGNEAACARANKKAASSIAYRDKNATAYQRDPNAAVKRANEKDQDSIAYRNAHCASGNSAACARANEKAKGAIAARNAKPH